MNKETYEELLSENIEERIILKEQLHKYKTLYVQVSSRLADVEADYLDLGGDKDTLDYHKKQSNSITINKWRNNNND
jgi:hypothetical protein